MKHIYKPSENESGVMAQGYIKLLPNDGLVLEYMRRNLDIMKELVRSFPEEKLTYRFAEGEWTIKEILGHVIDTERIFSYRALRFARNDTTSLPGFEQDDYVPYARSNERSLDDILEEYATVRSSTLALFEQFDDDALSRTGIASGELAAHFGNGITGFVQGFDEFGTIGAEIVPQAR